MADQSIEGVSEIEAKNCAPVPLLKKQMGNIQQTTTASEGLEDRRSVIRKIISTMDEDQESGLGSESMLDASFDSVESPRLSSIKFRKHFHTSLDSTGSSELQADENQLQTRVIPPPPQPLSKQDDLIKGCANTGFAELEECVGTEQEAASFVPAGTAQEPPIPPEPGSPSESSKKPNLQEQERRPNRPWLRTLRVRTVAAVTDRAFKYITFSVFCILGCISGLTAAMLLHLEEFKMWTSMTAAATAVLGLLGAILFCVKAADQSEQDDAERFATSRRENIQYEIIPERSLDPNVFSGGLPMD